MYIYAGHMGGLYVTEEPLDYDKLYCEECGDSDQFLGQADTAEEAWELLKEDTDVNGSGGWSLGYVYGFLKFYFGDTMIDEALRTQWDEMEDDLDWDDWWYDD